MALTLDLSIPSDRFKKAEELVGARPAELDEWAHDLKVKFIARALNDVFEAGARTMLEAPSTPVKREVVIEITLDELGLSPEVKALLLRIKGEVEGAYRDRLNLLDERGVSAAALIDLVLTGNVPEMVGSNEVLEQALRTLRGTS